MGRRSRQRLRAGGDQPEPLRAPDVDYGAPDGAVLTLRTALSPATRREYASLQERMGPAANREDVWQRATEFLFEHLAARWTIAGLPIDSQRELLARLRAASPSERGWIRETLRRHCAEHFPELQAP